MRSDIGQIGVSEGVPSGGQWSAVRNLPMMSESRASASWLIGSQMNSLKYTIKSTSNALNIIVLIFHDMILDHPPSRSIVNGNIDSQNTFQ